MKGKKLRRHGASVSILSGTLWVFGVEATSTFGRAKKPA